MAPNRVRGAAAALASGVSAGTIASSNGNAIAAPIPRRNVRRESTLAIADPPKNVDYDLSLYTPNFFPEESGRNYKATPYLEILKDLRNDFTVFSGLSHPGMEASGGHPCNLSFLTGATGVGRPAFKNSISLDQLVVETRAVDRGAAVEVAISDNGTGIPEAITGLVTVVPFNDLAAVEAAFARHPGEIAGMILEPIMMNAGIIYPDDGYLEALKDLLHAHGALLTFDEVKTGFTVGRGLHLIARLREHQLHDLRDRWTIVDN